MGKQSRRKREVREKNHRMATLLIGAKREVLANFVTAMDGINPAWRTAEPETLDSMLEVVYNHLQAWYRKRGLYSDSPTSSAHPFGCNALMDYAVAKIRNREDSIRGNILSQLPLPFR